MVRIQATSNPDEVKVNEEVVSWVALQQAGKVADAVTKKIDSGDVTGAEAELKAVIDKLQKYGSGTGSADAVRLLTELVQRLETRHDMGVTRKSARYYSSSFGRMSSAEVWTGPGLPPGFKLRRRGPVSLSTPLDIPDDLAVALQRSRRVTVLTGAGISAESGIPTFRDAATGFWANYDPQKLASPEGFQADPGLVTRWYDERRQQCAAVKPNPGHMAIAQMEKWYESRNGIFTLLTQTVDRPRVDRRGERYRCMYEYPVLLRVKLFYLLDLLMQVLDKLGVGYGHSGIVGQCDEEPHLFAAERLAGYLLAQDKYPDEVSLEIARNAERGLYQVHLPFYQQQPVVQVELPCSSILA